MKNNLRSLLYQYRLLTFPYEAEHHRPLNLLFDFVMRRSQFYSNPVC